MSDEHKVDTRWRKCASCGERAFLNKDGHLCRHTYMSGGVTVVCDATKKKVRP